jgi:hypothetical protein
MAEKTIGLKIQLNGVDTIITDIKTFETEIKKAREDLKGLEIGSTQFKKLSSEIGLAESSMLGLIQSTKRLTKEREIEGIGKLGQGIASSFAAATAAVSLFGTESEDVQKAAAAASNLLTLALSARGIAEVKLGAQLVARTIAERAAAAANDLSRVSNLSETASLEASTAAFAANSTAEVANTTVSQANSVATTEGTVIANTNTGAIVTNTAATVGGTAATGFFTNALRVLYTTMAANPYGVIIAAIGLLVTAYLALGKSQQEEIVKLKTIDELRREGLAQTENEITKIQILTSIIQDNNSSLLARQGAYEQLKKLVPELADLTLEEAQNQGILNIAIEREIKLIGLRAEQKAIENFLVQESEEALRKEATERKKRIEDLKEESYWSQFVNGFRVFVLNQAPKLNENQKEINRLEAKGTVGKKDLAKVTKAIVELEGQADNSKKKTKKSTEDATKAEEKRRKEQEELIRVLGERLKIEAQLIGVGVQINDLDNKILKTTEDNVSAAQDYAAQLNELKTVAQLYVELNNQLNESVDFTGTAFDLGQNRLEEYFDKLKEGNLTTQESALEYERLVKSLDNIKKIFALSPEDSKILDEVRLNYKSIFDTVNQFQNVPNVKPPFDAETWEQTLIDYELAIGKLINDPSQIVDPITKNLRRRSDEELAEAKRTAAERFKLLEDSFVKSYVSLKTQEAKVRGDFKNATSKDVQDFEKSASEAAKIAFDNLTKTGESVITFEQGIFQTTEKVKELNKQLSALAPAARAGFLIQNAEEISKQYDLIIPLVENEEEALAEIQLEIQQKTFDERKKYLDATAKLQADLLAQGIDIESLSYEQRLILLEKFLKKSVELTTKTDKDEEEKFKEKLSKIADYFDQFSSYIGEIGSLVQQGFQLQLDQLDINAKKAQESVIGDTEEANQKRLELEEQFQIQKAAIEKKATIRALQVQLVQAIADGASAVLNALSDGGPAAPILAVAAGVISALQIGIIQKQLNQAQSLAGGGLIFGPSHEKGGVYAGGGVNVEGGESVINKVSTVKYGSLLSSINQAGGGNALTSATQNGLMEERLMQAISKTNGQPIRAYVLNSEITNGQAINKRLSELASI